MLCAPSLIGDAGITPGQHLNPILHFGEMRCELPMLCDYDHRASAQMTVWKDRLPAGEIGNRIGPMEGEGEWAARSRQLKLRELSVPHRLIRVSGT